MTDARELMRRFIEDRESLSEDEMESLVEQLRIHPQLAAELKDLLIVDDLLAQSLDLTRWHFLPQIHQRIADECGEPDGLLPGASALGPEPDSAGPNSDAAKHLVRVGEIRFGHEPLATPEPKRSLAWLGSCMALAAVLAAGLMVGATLLKLDGDAVAKLEEVEGTVKLLHRDKSRAAARGMSLGFGDRLTTSAASAATIRFPDGTSVGISAETSIALGTGKQRLQQKRLTIDRGRLTADVARQPVGRPMIFQSPIATAEVLGTKLSLVVRDGRTHVKVAEGSVRLIRDSDHKSVVISQDQFGVSGPDTLATAPISWPGNREGLVFLFETNNAANQVLSKSSGMNRSYTVRPRGRARLNHDGAMMLTGGAFLAQDVDGEILAACRRTNRLSVEATITPASGDQQGPARIVTFSTDVNQRDFTLGQLGDKLIVRIRTPETGPNGVGDTQSGYEVCTLPIGRPSHVVVSYQPGILVCYLDGERVYVSQDVRGDFRDWSAQHLLFGDEYGGQRDWAGTLEGIAIYNRFIEPDEAQRNALQYAELRSSRLPVPLSRVRVSLVAKSAAPTPQAILPHRAALVVYRYRLIEVLNGPPIAPDLYVAHWAVLDGERQPIVDVALETESELLLEPWDRNPQVSHYFCSDDVGTSATLGNQFLAVQP